MFDQLGDIFNKELKNSMSHHKNRKSLNSTIEKYQSVEDMVLGSMKKPTKIKVGAYLTNLMCKNLTYKIGRKQYLLLSPKVMKQAKTKELGYIVFKKEFVDRFKMEIDKIHDLNIHIERSLPMIYQPAPWKNFNFGAYYLK